MLQNVYLLAKIGADTAENEQHLAEICQKLATTPRAADATGAAGGAPAGAPGAGDGARRGVTRRRPKVASSLLSC